MILLGRLLSGIGLLLLLFLLAPAHVGLSRVAAEQESATLYGPWLAEGGLTDAQGVLHTVTEAYAEQGGGIYYRRTRGDVLLTQEKLSAPNEVARAPTLLLIEDYPLVVWQSGTGLDTRIVQREHTPEGWSQPQFLSPSGVTARHPSLYLDGSVPVVAWSEMGSAAIERVECVLVASNCTATRYGPLIATSPTLLHSPTAERHILAFLYNGDLFTMRRDGTALRALTTFGDVYAFAWSPDAARIAIIRDPQQRGADVHVIDASGANHRQLTFTAEASRWVIDWHGDQIAFLTASTYPDMRIAAINPDTLAPTFLSGGIRNYGADFGVTDYPVMRWSPDGQWIALSHGDASGFLHVPSGSFLDRDISNPTWKSDSSHALIPAPYPSTGLRRFDPFTQQTTTVTTLQANYGAYAPDDRYIAFGTDSRLRRMSPTGSNVTTLAYYASTQPEWTPDSTSVAYVTWDRGGAYGRLTSLRVVDANGSNARLLLGGSARHPRWQPEPKPDKVAVFVHGWQGGDGYHCDDRIQGPFDRRNPPQIEEFKNVAATLIEAGYTIYFARWTTYNRYAIRAQAAAFCLREQLEQVREDTEVGRVTLIAHSMGGLVSRAYLEKAGLYQHDVDRLITFGTPHDGINLVMLVKLGLLPGSVLYCPNNPGLCQLGRDGVTAFNVFHRPSGAIPYDLIGGDGMPFLYPLNAIEGDNDGIVGTLSALALRDIGLLLPDLPVLHGSFLHRWRTNSSHTGHFHGAPLFGNQEYFADPTSVSCIRALLLGDDTARCPAAEHRQPVPSQEATSYAFTETRQGTLTTTTTQLPVYVDGDEARFVLTWDQGAVEYILRTPSGNLITPDNIGTYPGAQYGELGSGEWPPMALYRIPAPASGVWQVEIRRPVGSPASRYSFFAQLLSPLQLSVEVEELPTVGGKVKVVARLYKDGQPYEAATAEAYLRTSNTPQPIVLSQLAPGRFVGEIPAPHIAAQYHLVVVARGTTPPFTRQVDTFVEVLPSGLQLVGTSTSTDQPLDENDNGRYEALRITIPVDIPRTAPYVAVATLRAPDNTMLSTARSEGTWSSGTQVVVLDFAGLSIAQAGLDGPYSVDLDIFVADTEQRGLSRRAVQRTAAYQSHQFEGRTIRFPLILRDARPFPTSTHSLTNISFSPSSPASLPNSTPVVVNFQYSTYHAGGVRLWAVPYADGAQVGAYEGSPVEPAGTRRLTRQVTNLASTATVDEIRIEMRAADSRETLLLLTYPVSYTFAP